MFRLAEDEEPLSGRWLLAEKAAQALLVRAGASHHDAEDALQLTRIRAWESRDEFQSDRHYIAWYCTFARHRWFEAIRRRKHEVSVDHISESAKLHGATAYAAVDDHAIELLTRDAILDAIQTLPPRERLAIERTFMAVDGAASAAERSALKRARRQLERVRTGFASILVYRLNRIRLVATRLANGDGLTQSVVTTAAAVIAAAGLLALGSSDFSHSERIRPSAPLTHARAAIHGQAPAVSQQREVASEPTQRSQPAPARENHNPVPPFTLPVPRTEGVKFEPSDPADPAQRVCFSTIVTPYRCYRTGQDSIDFLIPELPR